MLSFILFTIHHEHMSLAYGSTDSNEDEEVIDDEKEGDPIITANDDDLTIELVDKGLDNPTTMAFLDVGEMLVLEKNSGTVRKIMENEILEEPLLEVNVASYVERGLLGIAIGNKSVFHNDNDVSKTADVFLYFAEASNEVDCSNANRKK